MSNILTVIAKRLDGTPLSHAVAETARAQFEAALPPTGSTVTEYGLRNGEFVGVATITEGTTQTQFQNFVDGIFPAAIGGTVRLETERRETLFECVIDATTASGQTYTVLPAPVAWSVNRT
jgi:hypothetical protein